MDRIKDTIKIFDYVEIDLSCFRDVKDERFLLAFLESQQVDL